MRIKPNTKRGVCLVELLLAALIILGVLAFIVKFGWDLYQAARRYFESRRDQIEREGNPDDPNQGRDPVRYYRHAGGWTV